MGLYRDTLSDIVDWMTMKLSDPLSLTNSWSCDEFYGSKADGSIENFTYNGQDWTITCAITPQNNSASLDENGFTAVGFWKRNFEADSSGQDIHLYLNSLIRA